MRCITALWIKMYVWSLYRQADGLCGEMIFGSYEVWLQRDWFHWTIVSVRTEGRSKRAGAHKPRRSDRRGASHLCGPSVWNFLKVTLLAFRILRWLINFWKVCAPLPNRTYVTRDADEDIPRVSPNLILLLFSLYTTGFWYLTPCVLVDWYWHLGGTCLPLPSG